MDEKVKSRKIITGKIVSDKMQNTVTVAVTHIRHHPVYKKAMRRVKKLKAQVQSGEYKVGDIVKIAETKPISKTKHFKVTGKIL
ncbi:30S ribosomal protein S17 [Candidatus Gottesmanbacteria bacterium RBG_16_43_7]|uniref:Small ribosomal subunit protein uS17 n=1 Tax=Candidatus Gottesmanbacteria bacterium RBG_16_43_7 TaxID=1798373 RepID=A0A1F5ZB27_9BACT|nr:MAG: 30S ribosomal protein S17 [Candidatus Gottesmanbacteria bacterium RBG_16_43_7]